MARTEVHTPCCLQCNKKLTPNYIEVRDNDPFVIAYEQKKYKTRITGYGYKSNNYFCSSHCGYESMVDLIKTQSQGESLRDNRKDDIEEANAHRGYNAKGTLTAGRLLEIRDRMYDKNAILNQDWISHKKMFNKKEV